MQAALPAQAAQPAQATAATAAMREALPSCAGAGSLCRLLLGRLFLLAAPIRHSIRCTCSQWDPLPQQRNHPAQSAH